MSLRAASCCVIIVHTMLHELAVENYAVVDRLRVQFHEGLNLLTGETGSGKSIVVDALGLLLGARASADAIRSGEDKARVSGIFDLPPDAVRVLSAAGFETGGDELLIEREILANGKSRAFVNNRPASVGLLRDLAPALGDIHGQHDQQLLFDPSAQLAILDGFAACGVERARVAELFGEWKRIQEAILVLEAGDQEKLRLLDLWQFQRREIENSALRPGEDAELEAERRVQQNAGKLLEAASAAYEALYESPESAWTTSRGVAKKLDELARIDVSMEPVRQTLEPALIALQDVAFSLRDYLGRVEANPARLEEIESRLAALDKLKRKYGPSISGMLEFFDDVCRKIDEVETAGDRLEKLRAELSTVSGTYEKEAALLTARRRKAGDVLGTRVEAELKPLAMERAIFRIELTPAAWSECGSDHVGFLVSANVGEEPKPMERIASGGELSRIALALKTCLVGHSSAAIQRTLVFDEIDTGISGRAAEGVARRLKKLSEQSQVLCVTHLPQIACFADHHYRVGKFERAGRTVAEIDELTPPASAEEIGRMLSGQTLTPEALRNAEGLIRAAQTAGLP